MQLLPDLALVNRTHMDNPLHYVPTAPAAETRPAAQEHAYGRLSDGFGQVAGRVEPQEDPIKIRVRTAGRVKTPGRVGMVPDPADPLVPGR